MWLWASIDFPFQSDEDFSSDGNLITGAYLLSKLEGIGLILASILVLSVHMPLVQRKASY